VNVLYCIEICQGGYITHQTAKHTALTIRIVLAQKYSECCWKYQYKLRKCCKKTNRKSKSRKFYEIFLTIVSSFPVDNALEMSKETFNFLKYETSFYVYKGNDKRGAK
jgi:hypothetical protein